MAEEVKNSEPITTDVEPFQAQVKSFLIRPSSLSVFRKLDGQTTTAVGARTMTVWRACWRFYARAITMGSTMKMINIKDALKDARSPVAFRQRSTVLHVPAVAG